MTKKLLPLLPSHKTYVEPFGGGASLLFAKPPAQVEVYNDLNSGLVNLFRVLRDEEKFKRFYRMVAMTPYSREEFDWCRENLHNCDDVDDVDFAWRWFVVARMSFGGSFGAGWGSNVAASGRGMAISTSAWLSTIERLPDIHARLTRVQIEHTDYRKILERYDTPETFFYLDPPYVHNTRRGGKYDHEMTDEDHEELVDIIKGLSGKVLLSGYAAEIYKPLGLTGWTRRDFDVPCWSVGKTRATGIQGAGACNKNQRRIESVWMNYDPCEVNDGLFKFECEQSVAAGD